MTAPSVLPAAQRWLLALLGASFLIDLVNTAEEGRRALGALPGALLLLGCAFAAMYQPDGAAVGGAATLVASTAVIRLSNSDPAWIGIQNLLMSEIVGGTVLLVFVMWQCRPAVAAGCTFLLVTAALLASLGRGSVSSATLFRSLQFGLLLLVPAVIVGIYLRGASVRRVETRLNSLIRRQWPLAAALGVLLFLEANFRGGSSHTLAMLGSLAVCVCAFFAPRAPVTFSLLGAASVALSPLLLAVGELLPGRSSDAPIGLTEVAASMCLIAFVVRYAELWAAALSTTAIGVATLVAFVLRAEFTGNRLASLLPSPTLFMLGFLLVVSVATGLYFRSRDRERAVTMRTAVTGAQQTERMALARELHDVVAHHVTGIVVQAQAARLVADRDPQVAVQTLERIETSGTEALKAMRLLVASMRGAKPAGTSEATEQATSDLTADLTAIVEHFSGPPVELDLQFPSAVPQEVGRSVLRLVQESLTNAGKYALGATGVHVSVTAAGFELHVRVTDDGTGRRADPAGGSGGYGLVGMRERVELLGGRFTAGPADPVGWRVEAWLPLWKEGT